MQSLGWRTSDEWHWVESAPSVSQLRSRTADAPARAALGPRTLQRALRWDRRRSSACCAEAADAPARAALERRTLQRARCRALAGARVMSGIGWRGARAECQQRTRTAQALSVSSALGHSSARCAETADAPARAALRPRTLQRVLRWEVERRVQCPGALCEVLAQRSARPSCQRLNGWSYRRAVDCVGKGSPNWP